MSSYNNGDLHTEYIDPQIYVPNGRASFDLDASKLAYLPNMRLLNVGVTSSAAGAYNRLVGSMSVIKNIRLLDGRTELSALRNPVPYLGFKAQQRTNADNKSSASWLKNATTGLEISEINDKLIHLYTNAATDVSQPGAATTPTNVGYLDLREVFPILNALPCLPTSVFANLRVEVEFQTGLSDMVTLDTALVNTSVRPILAVDSVENPELVAALSRALKDQGARWQEIEHDRFNIAAPAANTAGVVQTVSQQSMGFVGKRVERLLMVKTLQNGSQAAPAGTVNTGVQMGYGNAGSQAFVAQQTQVRLNGKNVFPGFGGITRPNERLGLVSDEYGACSAYPGSVFYNWSNANSFIDLGGASQQNSGKALAGQLSYDCVRIGARVADLQIQISRSADGAAGSATTAARSTNLPVNVNLYAEIDKSLVMGRDGSSYRIVYSA